jgi:hypothetical protein
MGWVQNIPVGKIKRVLVTPCALTPTMWVEAAVPALLQAFWTFESPDFKSVIHKTTGASWLCSLKGTLNEVRKETGSVPGPGTRAAFKFIEWVDLASWWLFIADIGVHGLINWQSALMHMHNCQNTPYGSQGFGEFPVDGGVADGRWNYGPKWFSAPGPNPTTAGPLINIPPGKSGFIAGQETLSPVTGGPVFRSGLQIIWEDTGEIVDQDIKSWEPLELSKTHHVFASGHNNTDRGRNLFIGSMMEQDAALPRYVGGGIGLATQGIY